jgi:hypothetical protein
VGDPRPEFRAARHGPFVVVTGPGQVQAQGVRLLAGRGRGQVAGQGGLAFGGVPLFAEHDVEAVAEGVAAPGPAVVRGERRGVQGTGPVRLRAGSPRAVLPGKIPQQCLDHVPGRHLAPVEAGPHALRVALPEHRAPAAGRVQARQQTVQVGRELPDFSRELIRRHRSTPVRPEHSAP